METRQILEELQLENVLATSSTGAVFLAGDPATGTDVVIKMVSCGVPDFEDEIRRLFLEMAGAARSGDIQAMPALTDHGLTPEGDGFLVMEVVEGRTLDSIDELSTFSAINILLEVLSCIEGLASVGSAHLNLKPANIFLTNSPANDRAKVLGFGTSATLLHAGSGVPIPAADPHLAPELVSGDLLASDQAWRSDLFSLGIIACGALGAEIEADGHDRPRVSLPAAVRSELPEAEPLEEILGMIMEPDPFKRGESPSGVRDPLIRALPDAPSVVVPASSRAESTGGYNPNKTDPAFEPPPIVTPAPGPTDAQVRITESPPAVDSRALAEDGDGWPEVFFDDPELPASLDDPEDTDVQNPVPGDVWVPGTDASGAAEESPAAVPPDAFKTRTGRRVSRTELVLVSAVILVLVSIIAFTWPSGGDDEGVAVATEIMRQERESSEGLVPPPPDDNLFDDLLAIQQLVDAGDLEAAREALNTFEGRDDVSFSSDESALYDSLVTAVAQASDRDAAIEDLRSGLGYGSIKMVRRGVARLAGVPAHEIDEIDGLAQDIARARKALNLHSIMREAKDDGDYPSAIECALRLETLLPGYSGAPQVRDESAAALEARAENLIADLRYSDAIAVLESLRTAWPAHDGPAARIAWCQDQIDLTRREGSLIENALAKGRAGDPEAGLAALDAMDPDPRMRDEADRARTELEGRLAEMDAETPTVTMATAMELGFKKNQTITVPLKVTDDYRVERVVVHARNEVDDGYLQIPLEPQADGLYHFVVEPRLHANKNVYFFVVARDHSGHVGRLGSQDEPHTITRKKWLKRLLK